MDPDKNITLKEIRTSVRKQTIGYIVGAFGLVAGLAWNEAIRALIEIIFPSSQNGLLMKFAYAVIATAIVVVISMYLVKKDSYNT